jgi:hypothetical protein
VVFCCADRFSGDSVGKAVHGFDIPPNRPSWNIKFREKYGQPAQPLVDDFPPRCSIIREITNPEQFKPAAGKKNQKNALT